jgi:hypothetical protein
MPSVLDVVDADIRALLDAHPQMPAAICAERIYWERGERRSCEHVSAAGVVSAAGLIGQGQPIGPASSASGTCGSRRWTSRIHTFSRWWAAERDWRFEGSSASRAGSHTRVLPLACHGTAIAPYPARSSFLLRQATHRARVRCLAGAGQG